MAGEEREHLSRQLKRRSHAEGEVLASADEVCASLLIVRSGVVTAESLAGADVRLGPGDYFGEGGMLTDAPKPATYRAMRKVVFYEIGRDALRDVIEARPGIAHDLALHLADRVTQLENLPELLHDRSAARQGVLSRIFEELLATMRRTH